MIKNIVFDLGNVIVRWEPYEVLQRVVPEYDPKEMFASMRKVWVELSCDRLTEDDAVTLYSEQFGIEVDRIKKLMYELKASQVLLPGVVELLEKLDNAGFALYSITDNIRGIMEYHAQNNTFLQYFKGIVVSTDIGVLKPDPRMYNTLLDTYNLNPAECVFIDDLRPNVEGAIAVGMYAFQFTDIISCEQKLLDFGVIW